MTRIRFDGRRRTSLSAPARGSRVQRGHSTLSSVRRRLFDDGPPETFDLFRTTFRRFVDDVLVPGHPRWERDGIVPRDVFVQAGKHGFLGMAAPAEFGGGGIDDFRYNLIIAEEIAAAGVPGSGLGITLHNDICLPYFSDLTTDEQKGRWLPGICSGELITAVAMTEPHIGSDLAGMRTSAVRHGDTYVVNGSKTFITNGINADLVICAVKTDPNERHRGMSLLVLERGMPGFERGRNLDKVGMHAQDTAELFFTDVEVPVDNLLGTEGGGFGHLVDNLAQERLSIAMTGVASARAILDETLTYARERHAFGQPIGSFQHNRFTLAELTTEVEVAQAFVDRCVEALNDDELSVEEAAMAKWWCTELHKRTADACVQLHGGYGYMLEYPVARAWVDARITTIYGGTTEIMKEIIGRSLGV
jgi:alkylation response protein AidB-like acyl-CoA dehydrogenase